MKKIPMRERVGALREYWYVACTSEDLKVDKPHSSTILETRLVLWRNKQGEVSVLRDRCSHRNVFLSEGKVKKNCIKCPYHGWTFDSEGNCVNVPSEGENGKPFSNRKVERFPVIEQEGLVWVWMGESKEPDPEKKPFPMPFYGVKGWKTYYMVTEFDNGVTHLAENFMDVPHTVFVHEGWFRDRTKKLVKATVERTENSVLVTYDQTEDAIGFAERLLNPKKLPLYHTDNFYMPNNTRVDYVFGNNERGFVITSTSTPVSDFKSQVYTCISYNLGILQPTAKYWLPWYTRQVIEQDVEIMANQGASLQEEEPDFKSTPADTLHLFIESLREWEESGCEGPRPKPMKREMDFWI
ncbi:MAG: aromatic ring-hydroxylating dioxygenase subunit alpha [Ketobacteraceae bacterium]|nr:aromatic ring-hydroxylating dioxygenase subunit alpha [Ketobacteraceae bacterium]